MENNLLACIPDGSGPPASFQGDVNIDSISPEHKTEGDDWFALFNSNVERRLDVDLMHTLIQSSVVCCVKFSADGKYLALGSNRVAGIYDAETSQRICHLVDETVDQTDDLYIRAVCFSPDGKYLATGAEDKHIRVWDIAKRRIRNVLDGHQQEIYSLDFSLDGRFLVSGSADQTARIWDMHDGTSKVLTINDPRLGPDGITSVAISPNGKYVAAGNLDAVVRIWDVNTAQLVERLGGHNDSVYSVTFTPDGQGLISGSLDKTLKYWDVSGLGEKPTQSKMNFLGHRDYVLAVAVSHDDQWVVSGSKDRSIQFWDACNGQAQCLLQGHKNSIVSVALSPVGNLLATGSGDCQARIWRYTTRTT